MSARYRFGGVEFDSGTGDLQPLGTRLPRQPARLLALLAARPGEVVSREEIRRQLWDDATVEYDKSLHFCIHQIRSALGESASEPRFIETIPRQGYRLIPEVERIEQTAPPAERLARRIWAPLLAIVIALLGWMVVFNDAVPPPQEEARILRVGVMTFVPPAEWPGAAFPTVAEWILEELASNPTDLIQVIGPATTVDYELPERTLRDLAADYELDYIVNGRFLSDADPPSMLAELIRTSDGAHIWVKRYEAFESGKEMGLEISRESQARLPL